MIRNPMEQIIEYAEDILPEYPGLLQDFEGFQRVMWSDDAYFGTLGMTRDEYSDLLRRAYKTLIA